jgi:predicted metal-dependent phosphoesterase TrpH
MKIDLHCHTKYSQDNFLEPEEVVEQAISMGLDGICMTEHYSMIPLWPLKKIKIPEGFYIFRGVEISTDRGHLLAYGVKDDSWNIWSSNNYLDLFRVIENVHRLGGICVPAHPFRGSDSFGDALYQIDNVDAIETHNGLDTEEMSRKALQAAKMKNLPSIGGSDCHNKNEVGRAFTEFKNHVRTIDELVEEIKRGHCRGVRLSGCDEKKNGADH